MKLLIPITLIACIVAIYAVLRPIHQAKSLIVEEIILVDKDGQYIVNIRPAGITFVNEWKNATTVVGPGYISIGEGENKQWISLESYE